MIDIEGIEFFLEQNKGHFGDEAGAFAFKAGVVNALYRRVVELCDHIKRHRCGPVTREDVIEQALGMLLKEVQQLREGVQKMTQQMDALVAQVEANTNVISSAMVLINGLVAQLTAAKDDPAKVQAVIDSLKGSDDELAAAVAANTPAVPAEPTL